MVTSELIQVEKIFGKTVIAGGYALIKTCPICRGDYTFRFLGTKDLWECKDCGNSGSWEDLESTLADKRKMLSAYRGEMQKSVPDGLILLSEWENEVSENRVMSGFECLDRMIGGFGSGHLTVMTGKRGEGKSTLGSQLALNAANQGVPVFFYSGELNVHLFRRWVLNQAAGVEHLVPKTDEAGEQRWFPDYNTESRIIKWLGENLVLYDNSVAKSSERNAILERMNKAYIRFGCGIYFIDNLMTARYAIDNNQNYYRAQSNFVSELVDFAQQKNVHIVLVAHPRKSIAGEEEDLNDNVAGSSDVTNRASNVLRVVKLSDKQRESASHDCELIVTKNREHGRVGKMLFHFDEASKRFIPSSGKYIGKYSWQD
jgi:twinkle protein